MYFHILGCLSPVSLNDPWSVTDINSPKLLIVSLFKKLRLIIWPHGGADFFFFFYCIAESQTERYKIPAGQTPYKESDDRSLMNLMSRLSLGLFSTAVSTGGLLNELWWRHKAIKAHWVTCLWLVKDSLPTWLLFALLSKLYCSNYE